MTDQKKLENLEDGELDVAGGNIILGDLINSRTEGARGTDARRSGRAGSGPNNLTGTDLGSGRITDPQD